MYCKIAIDGPAGSGKTTVAKLIAQKLNIDYLDTGAMYRIIGLYLHNLGVDPKESNLDEFLKDLIIDYSNGTFYLNGKKIEEEIRTPEAGMYASMYAANPQVRKHLTKMQQEICKNKSIVAEGRDIGTVVMPDARVKIFLVASPEIRAQRRYKELKEKGIDVSYDELLTQIKKRDENDSTREVAPLIKPHDAIEIDTSNLTIEQVVEKILQIVKERCCIS
ncbi:MAG: (d)CMP kinase [Fervidobacterium sp.]|nr:(d)CMP kinase [Fervidobacterium sp.]